MKPVVSAMNAWSCVVISAFAIIILSVIGGLFQRGHHSLMGSTDDPQPEHQAALAGSIFTAVFVYIAFLVFCGLQACLHIRQSKRGAITLN